MPSGLFKFKGIDLTDIYSASGNYGVTGYPDIPLGEHTNYVNSRCLNVGYTYYDSSNGSNLYVAENAKANFITKSSSNTLTIPSGAKQYRYIGAGGAGGGGGGGGGVLVEETSNSYAHGGHGGYGGHGGIKYGGSGMSEPYHAIDDWTYMRVHVGGGGGGGTGGDGRKENDPGSFDTVYQGSPGNSGGDGGNSYIFLTNSSSDTSASGNTTPAITIGSVGKGGKYGDGGKVIYASKDTIDKGPDGGAGADGSSGSDVNEWENWGYPAHNNYGAEGNANSDNANKGGSGGAGDEGWVSIIWLWD